MKPTENEIEVLKTQHGQLHLLELDDEAVVAKAPTRALWKRFRAQTQDETKRLIAAENLVRDCVVWPAKNELEAMWERKPGLIESFGSELLELAGLSNKVEKKAL